MPKPRLTMGAEVPAGRAEAEVTDPRAGALRRTFILDAAAGPAAERRAPNRRTEPGEPAVQTSGPALADHSKE